MIKQIVTLKFEVQVNMRGRVIMHMELKATSQRDKVR